jgi:hypothetical protein
MDAARDHLEPAGFPALAESFSDNKGRRSEIQASRSHKDDTKMAYIIDSGYSKQVDLGWLISLCMYKE